MYSPENIKGQSDPGEPLEKIEYQSIDDISFEEVIEGHPDFEEAYKITADPEESAEEVLEKIKKQLINESWWLQPEWREKGTPKEEIEVLSGDSSIRVYNFGEEFDERHLEELKNVVGEFSQIKNGKALNEVSYILVNDTQKKNPYTGEDGNGIAFRWMRAIVLYPRATKFFPFRVEGSSNFEGTLLHEFTHPLIPPGSQIDREWIEKFGWSLDYAENDKHPSGLSNPWILQYPERCVTDYAKHTPSEDICESMVAALRNPDVLDPEKLKFIKEKFFTGPEDARRHEQEVVIKRRTGEDIELPKVRATVKFRKVKIMVKIVKKSGEEAENN